MRASESSTVISDSLKGLVLSNDTDGKDDGASGTKHDLKDVSTDHQLVNYSSCRRRLFFHGKKDYRDQLIERVYLNVEKTDHVDYHSITDVHTRLSLKYHVRCADANHYNKYSPFTRHVHELNELIRLFRYVATDFGQRQLLRKRQERALTSPYCGNVFDASLKYSGRNIDLTLELEYLLSLSFPPCLEEYRKNCIRLLEILVQ